VPNIIISCNVAVVQNEIYFRQRTLIEDFLSMSINIIRIK